MFRSLRTIALAGMLGLAAPVLAMTTAVAAPTLTLPTVVTPKAAAKSSSNAHITIPKTYQYHPHSGDKALHDYCTASPDKYYTIGKDADFRGPCARHDMCIQYHQHKRSTCDSYLLANMKSECRYTYKHSYDPRHGGCLATAYIYWTVVHVKTVIAP